MMQRCESYPRYDLIHLYSEAGLVISTCHYMVTKEPESAINSRTSCL